MMAALLMGLTGCSNEDFPGADSNVPAGKPVAVTLTVGRGAEATRTTLTPEGLGLKDEWEGNEELTVFNNQGLPVGTVTFAGYVNEGDKKVANFSGEVTAEDGTHDFYVWYLGKNTDGKKPYAELAKRVVDGNNKDVVKVVLNNQSGKFEDLPCADVMSAKTKLTVTGNRGANAEKVNLTNRLCMLRIDLGIQGGSDISGATLNIKNGENDLFTNEFFVPDGEHIASTRGAESFIIDNVNTAEDVYFALWPNDREDITLRFELTKGANTYTATLNPNRLEAGIYYTNGTISGSDGLPGGVSVTLVNTSLNPLSKWAETNLERVSDTQYYKGKFAASYTENGCYYQFGRNVGFTNYSDADNWAQIYNPDNEEVSWGQGDGNNYSQKNYYTTSNVNSDNFSHGFMIPCLSGVHLASDWWPSASNSTDTWDERATACGYTPSDLYVINGEKWKVPSIADFEEIMPSGGLTSGLTTYTEVKKARNNSWVAFQWKKISLSGAYYLQIKAKVVPDQNSGSSINWDDNQDNEIETRYFKAAGFIAGYHFYEGVWSKLINYNGDVDYHWNNEYSQNTFITNGYTYNGLMHAATAVPFSNPSYQMTTVSAGVIGGTTTNDIIDVRIIVNPSNIFDKYFGGYWTSDNERKIMNFVFDENSNLGGSRFKIADSKAHAYSIRLIRAE